MKEVFDFLRESQVQYLATNGLDGRPKVRPFQFMYEKDGKVYYCTSNQKDVYAQMIACPYIELSSMNKDYAWIRVSGKAVFVQDPEIKKEVFNKVELVQSIYQSPDNPIFGVFTLDDVKAVIADFSGNPPREYTL